MNWIDIKDREPEDSGNVLVSVKLNYSDVPMVTVSWYNRLMR